MSQMSIEFCVNPKALFYHFATFSSSKLIAKNSNKRKSSSVFSTVFFSEKKSAYREVENN